MKWHNILQNQCPQCWKQLTPNPDIGMATCSCGFAISYTKMRSIAAKFAEERMNETDKNLIGDRDNDDVL